VAGTKNTALSERNRRICTYRRNGFTYSEIADLEGVSRARVAQIVAETTPELPEDDGRAELASLLEYAERKCVDLIEHPGYVCGPNGRVVESPDGEPLPNKQIVDNALRTLIVIAERKARTFGWDKQVKRETPADIATQQMWAAIAAERQRLEQLARQGAVVPGEVVRELEA
jgi:transcriptional regulator with XRE-family HTH domain